MPSLRGLKIFDNAERLLSDAQLLRSHRRYPSAAALAILSLEEAAKFAMVNKCLNVGKPDSGGQNNHSAKQRVAGELLIGGLLMSEADEILDLRREKDPTVSIECGGERTIASQLAEIITAISDDEYEARLRGKFKKHKYNKILFDVLAGKYNAIKKRCLYVDVGSTSAMSDEPCAINREMADRAISLARNCMRQIRGKIAYLDRMERLSPDASLDNQTQTMGGSTS